MPANEVFDLAADFQKAAVQAVPALRGVVQEGMSDLKDGWVANARATSGRRGKHYPNSITYETKVTGAGISGEVGPDSSKLQGSMGRGFEFGSVNQPPHLDGARALETTLPNMQRRFDAAISYLVP